MDAQSVTIEIKRYRGDRSSRQWELPAWGHPISQGILPLFATFEDYLFPVGTAFTIGRGVPFVVSAAHNIRETLKKEERLSHLLNARELPESCSISGMLEFPSSITAQIRAAASISLSGHWRRWLRAPPADVVFPQFQSKRSASRPLMRQRGWRRAVASSRAEVRRYVGPDDRRCDAVSTRSDAALFEVIAASLLDCDRMHRRFRSEALERRA